MTWLTFKYGAKKTWLWFKKYGWLVVLGLFGVILVLTRKDGVELAKKMIGASDERFKGEQEVLRQARENEIKRTADYHKLEAELQEKYNLHRSETKKAMEKAIKENNEKSIEELAEDIARALGAEVRPPPS